MDREHLLLKLSHNIPVVDGKNVWIWGAGHTAQLYQEGLKRIDKFKICGYCDNDEKKWGGVWNGKPVISPEQLVEYKNVCVLICSPQNKVIQEVGTWLDQNNIEWYRLDETILKLYRMEILECYDLLDSQASKDIYAHIIERRMTSTMPADLSISDNQYFALPPFRAYHNEVFVDCGAFTGDTLEQYIWKKHNAFHKIIAFEPDRNNFQAMVCRTERLKKEWNLPDDKIVLHCKATGEETGRIPMLELGTIESITGGMIAS